MLNVNQSYNELLTEFEKKIYSKRNREVLNKEGQFFTPKNFANQIMLDSLKEFKKNGEKVKFLEPAVGHGSFINSLIQNIDEEELVTALGIEKDKEIYEFSKKMFMARYKYRQLQRKNTQCCNWLKA